MKPYIYITRWNTKETFEEKRRDWFRRKKGPELISLGFLSARCFNGDAFPQGCNLYEVDDLKIFDRPDYLDTRNDPFVPEVMQTFNYNSKTFYDQVVVTDTGGNDLTPIPTLAGGAVSLLYFDAPDAGAVAAWFRTAVIGAGGEGVRTFRLWDETGEHPQKTLKEPRWCAAIEWRHGTSDDGARLRAAASRLSGINVTRSDVLRKWYGVLREDAYEAAAN